LASDGVDMLKQYLAWREKSGEKITDDSPLFSCRTKKCGKGNIIADISHPCEIFPTIFHWYLA